MPTAPRRHDQRGASAAEYALIVSLIAVALIGALLAFGGALDDLFRDDGARISDLP